ncbi:VOC family protein [Bradyrhizobium betae]
MYDHIGLRVADLDAATRFYTAVLAPLGHVLCSSGDGYAGFGPKGEPALWLHLNKARKADGAHIAFRAADHDAVKAFTAKASRAAAATMAVPARARITARPTMRRS